MVFIRLENANELTKSIVCDSLAVGELIKRWVDCLFVPSLSSPLSFFNDNRSKPRLNVWFARIQSLFL